MPTDPIEATIEEQLERLAEDPPTVEEAKEIFESSGRFNDVEVIPSDEATEAERQSSRSSNSS